MHVMEQARKLTETALTTRWIVLTKHFFWQCM